MRRENRRARANNKLNPHIKQSQGIKPEPHWWEESALTTAPSLLHPPPNEMKKLRFDEEFTIQVVTGVLGHLRNALFQ